MTTAGVILMGITPLATGLVAGRKTSAVQRQKLSLKQRAKRAWIGRKNMTPTVSKLPPVVPHRIGNVPETLRVLLGAMEVRRQFIKQAYTDSEEYWECQRELANLERRWAEAEALWAKYVAKEMKGG